MFIHDVIKMELSRQGYLPDHPYHLISDSEMFDAFICYRMLVDCESASKIIQGDSSLWESPKAYVTLYGLKSFEFVDDGDAQVLVIEGSKSKLDEFNTLSGLCTDVELSPDCYFSINYPLEYGTLSNDYEKLIIAICYHINAYLNSITTDSTYEIPDWVYSYMLGSVIGVNSAQQDIHDLLVLLGLDNIDDVFTEKVYKSCRDISYKWISKLPPSKNVMRPPTIFGEPHVIKSLRIAGLLGDDEAY